MSGMLFIPRSYGKDVSRVNFLSASPIRVLVINTLSSYIAMFICVLLLWSLPLVVFASKAETQCTRKHLLGREHCWIRSHTKHHKKPTQCIASHRLVHHHTVETHHKTSRFLHHHGYLPARPPRTKSASSRHVSSKAQFYGPFTKSLTIFSESLNVDSPQTSFVEILATSSLGLGSSSTSFDSNVALPFGTLRSSSSVLSSSTSSVSASITQSGTISASLTGAQPNLTVRPIQSSITIDQGNSATTSISSSIPQDLAMSSESSQTSISSLELVLSSISKSIPASIESERPIAVTFAPASSSVIVKSSSSLISESDSSSISTFSTSAFTTSEPQISVAACSLVPSILQEVQAPTLTSFCSQFLSIATMTITSTTSPGATTVTTTSTATTTVTSFSLTSTTVSTITQTATTSTTLTITTVATTTSTSLGSTTVTSTATVYYHLDGAPVSRREAAPIPVLDAGPASEIVERAFSHALDPRQEITIPPALALLESSIISSVCSCLHILTPTATSIVTASTPTITSTVETTSTTVTLSGVITTSLTTTTTTVTVSSSTTLTGSAAESTTSITTFTSTTTRSVPAACTSEPPNNYPFPDVTRPRSVSGRFSGGTRLNCCVLCYQAPNCILYAYFFEPGTCYSVYATDQLTTGVSNYCPLGVSPVSQISTDTNDPGFGGYQNGPCNIGASL